VALTREGELFLAHCRQAVSEVDTARDAVAQARRVAQGDVTLSLPFVLGPHLVRRLEGFHARFPSLALHLHVTDRHVRLGDESVDVAIRVGLLADSSLIVRRLMQPRWATVASPRYLARRGTPERPSDLAGHECLKFRPPRGGTVEWVFAGARREPERVRTAGRLDTDQGELLVDAALAGLGLCQVFDVMVERHVRDGTLVEVLRDFAAPGPPVHALCLAGQQRVPRVRALLDYLRDELGGRTSD
jgi:DNA-binding transcriptional LysR family regulator